ELLRRRRPPRHAAGAAPRRRRRGAGRPVSRRSTSAAGAGPLHRPAAPVIMGASLRPRGPLMPPARLRLPPRPDRAALLLLALTPLLSLPFRKEAPMPPPSAPPGEAPPPGVSRDLARRRAAAVSGVRYRLSLDLRPGADRLTGRAEVRLSLARAD